MINPNLDAGYPTLLGIRRPETAAMPSSATATAITPPPSITTSIWAGRGRMTPGTPCPPWTPVITFDVQSKVIYNIYKTGSGEIISGRVTTAAGAGLNGATVTATGPGGP